MHETIKAVARAIALVIATPALISFAIRRRIFGSDRSIEGSTQAFALLPGLVGEYVRRAFLSRTLAYCDPTATVRFGTVFSQTGCRLDANVYVGPGCHLGLVHLERDVLLAAGVHVPSGGSTHAGFGYQIRAYVQPRGVRRAFQDVLIHAYRQTPSASVREQSSIR